MVTADRADILRVVIFMQLIRGVQPAIYNQQQVAHKLQA